VIAKVKFALFVAMAMLGPFGVGACVADVDNGDTTFACSDGVCPDGYSCLQALCLADVEGDGGMASDAAFDSNATDAAPLVACDVLFGQAPGYQLCSEDEVSCSFNVNLAGETCTAACQMLQTTCLGAFDNNDDLCLPVEATGDTCDTTRSSEICVCARP
jgi:hypothetical protein